MKLKRKEIKEKVSKTFLLSLLEPYHPTLMPGEKIIDVDFTYFLPDKDHVNIIYTISKGGVKHSKELCKGDAI
jgi:hypothetical protein